MIRLNPYLNFREGTREAMEYYHSTFGGELDVSTFAGSGMPGLDEADADKVMHAMLTAPDGLVLMASDTPTSMGDPNPNGTMSLSGDDEPRLRSWWEQLSDGGTVVQPLEPAPWGDQFGMCTDRFGVAWMVNISSAS